MCTSLAERQTDKALSKTLSFLSGSQKSDWTEHNVKHMHGWHTLAPFTYVSELREEKSCQIRFIKKWNDSTFPTHQTVLSFSGVQYEIFFPNLFCECSWFSAVMQT